MLKPEVKETILRALGQYRGDDLARARNAFSGMSQAEMMKEHGMSGRTRQQVIDGYAAHDKKVEEAIGWMKAQ